MSAISAAFKNKKAYVAYLMAGDGGFEHSLSVMKAYADAGVDIIEVGVPFSDPVADGPVIQMAADRALAIAFTIHDVFKLIQTFKQTHNTAIVLFSYFNPILQYSNTLTECFKDAKISGVDGCLIVDMPLEESMAYKQACINAGIDSIYIIAPSTPKDRIATISQHGSGMLYYACRNGVTGMKDNLPAGFSDKIAEIKSVSRLPVVAGFGISDAALAGAVLAHADGFVVGSKLVALANNDDALASFKNEVQSIDPR